MRDPEDTHLYNTMEKVYSKIKYDLLKAAVFEEFDRLHRGGNNRMPRGEALQAALLQFKLIDPPVNYAMEDAAAEYEMILNGQDLLGL